MALASIALGCAPSYRLVHEGDRYFERCYGADFDTAIAREQKEACWQAWLTYYTKQQPAHRVDFALARIEALQNGEPPPTLPGLGEAQQPAPRDASVNQQNAVLLATMAADAGPVPNGCLHFCNEYESGCNARCVHGSLACSANCERERALCLNGCY